MPLPNYKSFEKILGIKFKQPTLLKKALTHSSFVTARGRARTQSNEILEFIGDAVLELITREYLCTKFPEATEGALSTMKKNYTSTGALYDLGMKLNIGKFLLMDKGEEYSGGREKTSNIAGAVEAIIGALYVDQGLKTVKNFITGVLFPKISVQIKDFKSYLNEWTAKKGYTFKFKLIKESGPAHNKLFYVSLYINNKKVSTGTGKTKKEAEQKAAEQFFNKSSS